jgi:hypothetical protein
MRSKISLFTFLLVAGLFVLPTLANAAAIPFFGPIIPQEGTQAVCPAGWEMLITVINNIIAFSITIAIVFVAPIMIAYAGFLFVVNPVNASGKETAKKVLWNTVVGIVIALAGWMIVDAIMVVLYNPRAVSGTTRLTAWSQLITSGGLDPCIDLRGSLNQATNPQVTGAVLTTASGATATNVSTAANAYVGSLTSAGPSDGRFACAWAVNNVLRNAGVATVDGDSVAAMESTLRNGRGTQVNEATALPGDIIIFGAGSHVGICAAQGCTKIDTNSSSQATFQQVNAANYSLFVPGQNRIYRLNS